MIRTVHCALAALIVVTAACTTQTRSGSPVSERAVLSSEEMLKAGFPDVFTTVQSLRPQWLQRRGGTSLRRSGEIKVYLDGSLLGNTESLKQITTRSISTIRYFTGLEASERWGLDHDMGAILVTTRRN